MTLTKLFKGVAAFALVGAGCYGFIYDLALWGVPMIIGAYILTHTNEKSN